MKQFESFLPEIHTLRCRIDSIYRQERLSKLREMFFLLDHGSFVEEKQRFITIRDALASLGVYEKDYTTGEVYPNKSWQSWGYSPEDMKYDNWLKTVHPDDRERVRQEMQTLPMSGKQDFTLSEFRIITKGGRTRWIHSKAFVISRDENKQPARYVGADFDITRRKIIEKHLRIAKEEAEQRAQEAETLRIAGAVVASTLDSQQAVNLILQQAKSVVPYDTASVQILGDEILTIVGGLGWKNLDLILGKKIPIPGDNPNTSVLESRVPLLLNDINERFPELSKTSPKTICSWIGIPLIIHSRVIGMLTFDSWRKGTFTANHLRLATAFGDHVAIALENARLYEEVRELAITDSLTGASTRRRFNTYAEQQLQLAYRHNNDLPLLMIDIDFFKHINDNYGHPTGDEVLKNLVNTCKSELRSFDEICRYGGEEFLILLPRTNKEQAVHIADRLHTEIGKIGIPGTEKTITVSIGVCSLSDHPTSNLNELIFFSDQALYDAKRNGRNQVCCDLIQ